MKYKRKPRRTRKALPKLLREKVKAQFGGRCGYCGQRSEKLHVDHVIPHAYGGSDEESNLMPACPSCNSLKYKLSVESFRTRVHKHIATASRFGHSNSAAPNVMFFFEAVRILEKVEE